MDEQANPNPNPGMGEGENPTPAPAEGMPQGDASQPAEGGDATPEAGM